AKVRAMHGKRITKEDYAAMREMHTVPEIGAYLKRHPSWAEPLRDLPPDVNRAQLEAMLLSGRLYEYVRIYKFMQHDDHPMLKYMLLYMEMDEILSFLRHLQADSLDEYTCRLIPFFRRHIPVDFDKFAQTDTYDGFLELLAQSSFRDLLLKLPRPDGGMPDYTLIKVVFTSHYYATVLKTADRLYGSGSETAAKIQRGFGSQVDLINLCSILRIKRFFPGMEEDILSYLMPLSYRLKPAFTKELYTSSSAEHILELIKTGSPYAKLFNKYSFHNLEDYQYQFMYDFNIKELTAPTPSPYTPVAYLTLKEIEVKNLVGLIECARYGITLEQASVLLIGV
ncbi:V-type ATPase subunit, partial [Oscillospiraceae bacterium OttesenSCG-928-F05]|nr:V-type ATPase subunit [Oscillospiraceae bacterium OttesenSCG-928-F05]